MNKKFFKIVMFFLSVICLSYFLIANQNTSSTERFEIVRLSLKSFIDLNEVESQDKQIQFNLDKDPNLLGLMFEDAEEIDKKTFVKSGVTIDINKLQAGLPEWKRSSLKYDANDIFGAGFVLVHVFSKHKNKRVVGVFKSLP